MDVEAVSWGRVAAVLGGLVVAYALLRGIAGALGIAAGEVMYRAENAVDWIKPWKSA